jgi:uncharacterized membrane protein
MAVGVLLAACGVLPQDCAGYDVVWQYLMPLAAGAYLVDTDMSQLVAAGGPTLVAFLVGAVGMTVGAVVAWALVHPLMQPWPDSGKIAACLCASYVGGSVNFAAVAKVRRLIGSATRCCGHGVQPADVMDWIQLSEVVCCVSAPAGCGLACSAGACSGMR